MLFSVLMNSFAFAVYLSKITQLAYVKPCTDALVIQGITIQLKIGLNCISSLAGNSHYIFSCLFCFSFYMPEMFQLYFKRNKLNLAQTQAILHFIVN